MAKKRWCVFLCWMQSSGSQERERQHCIEGIVRVLEVGGETTLGDLDDTPVPPPPPHMSSAY